MRDCTDPDCHANAFAAAHAWTDRHIDRAADDPTHADTDCDICALGYVQHPADEPTESVAHRHPDPHADDDPTADTAY